MIMALTAKPKWALRIFLGVFVLVLCALAIIWPRLETHYNISYDLDAKQPLSGHKDFIEWWYFDGQINDHNSFILTYYLSSRGNWVELTLYNGSTNETRVFHSDVDPKQTRWSDKAFSLNMAGNWAVEKNGVYSVFFKHEDCALWFDLTPSIKGFGKKTHFPLERYAFWPWIVAVPRGKIQGVLEMDGKKIEIRGEGYHDQTFLPRLNYYPFSIPNWYWGRFYTEHYTVIMDSINLKTNRSSSFYLFKNSEHVKTLYRPDLFSKDTYQRINRKNMPEELRCDFGSGSIIVKNNNISRVTEWYTRFVNKARIEVVDQGKEVREEGTGLSDVVW
jgi:hypothetical protein